MAVLIARTRLTIERKEQGQAELFSTLKEEVEEVERGGHGY